MDSPSNSRMPWLNVVTGVLFIGGAWINKGQYVGQTNRWLGIFYILFGAIGMN